MVISPALVASVDAASRVDRSCNATPLYTVPQLKVPLPSVDKN